jgi:hypothetical protein
VGCRHPGTAVVDDDGPLRTHTESAGGFDEDCGRHTIDTDTEKLFNPSGFQELLTARAQRIDRRRDPDVKQLAHEVDRRLARDTISVGEHIVEVEDDGVMVARVDGDRCHGEAFA